MNNITHINLNTRAGRAAFSKQNDNQTTENLRNQILEDTLTLRESDWRRGERVATLNQMRLKAISNHQSTMKERSREKQIDALRMQPYVKAIQDVLRSDLSHLRRKDIDWDRLYTSISELDVLINTISTNPNNHTITTRQIQDGILHVTLVTNTMPGIQDPAIESILARANVILTQLCNECLNKLEKILNSADGSSKYYRQVEIALKNAIDAGAGGNGEPLKPARTGTPTRALLIDARTYLEKHVGRVTLNHRDRLEKGSTSKTVTGEDLHQTLTSFRHARLHANMSNDSSLIKSLENVKKLRGIKMKTSYNKLKLAMGYNNTNVIKVRSFRHALSRQEGGGDTAPTGMISEWSYDSANDVYSYPRGPVESSTLKGFQLGALKSDKISRYVTTKKNTTTNNNKEEKNEKNKTSTSFLGKNMDVLDDNDAVLQWKFQIGPGGSVNDVISSLRIKATSSAVGKSTVAWAIRGGKRGTNNTKQIQQQNKDENKGKGQLKFTSTSINKKLTSRLGSSSYCDVSNHVLKWDWFVIEARFIHHDGTSSGNSGRGGEEVHIEDVQLFRSKNGTKSISTPQLSIQMGLKLNKKEKEEKDEQLLKYSDVKDAYESCDRNGVVRLGSDAKSLMEQAKMFLEEEENKDKDSKK